MESAQIPLPSYYFQGCTAHGLQLLVKDIFAATKTTKAGENAPTFPNNYPFQTMYEFADECKDSVKFFYNHHAVKSKLNDLQKNARVPYLSIPAPTRWGSIQKFFQTLLQSEQLLYSIVTERNFVFGSVSQRVDRERIKTIVTEDDFEAMLTKAQAILHPVDEFILKCQSDAVPVSDVMHDFRQLADNFKSLRRNEVATDSEVDYLVNLSASRFKFMYGDAHGISYMLDPRFIGEVLPRQNKNMLEATLVDTPLDDKTPVDDVQRECLFMELTGFTIALQADRVQQNRFKMLQKGSKSPLQY
jgi:hypothetical protein